MRPCQGRDGSSILPSRTNIKNVNILTMEKLPGSSELNQNPEVASERAEEKIDRRDEVEKIMEERLKNPDFIVRNVQEAVDEVNDILGLPLSAEGTAFDRVSQLADIHLTQWGKILLEAARNAEGQDRHNYALALKRLSLLVSPQVYTQMLQEINIDSQLIDDLMEKPEKPKKKWFWSK